MKKSFLSILFGLVLVVALTFSAGAAVANADSTRDYSITLKTLDTNIAGTSNKILVQFFGASGKTDKMEIKSGDSSGAEQNSEITVTLKGADVGAVTSLELSFELNENDADAYRDYFSPDYCVFEGQTYDLTKFGKLSPFSITVVRTGYFADINYISELVLVQDDESSTCSTWLSENGYTIVPFDLNSGAGGDYVYVGYKTTHRPFDAITGICVRHWETKFYQHPADYDVPTSTVYGSRSMYDVVYNVVGGQDLDDDEWLSYIDLNAGTARGWNQDFIYLYTTTSWYAGQPLTALSVNTSSYDAGWSTVSLISKTAAFDLNKGAEGDYVFMHYQRADGSITGAGSIFGEYSWAFIIGGCVIFVAAVAVVLVVVLKRRNKTKAASKQ